MRTIRSRKAVSPVIATVILVAVAITVAVAVAYWMGGIAGQYTKFEKVEIQSGWSEKITNGWKVTLELKNTGSATASLIRLFINDIPLNSTGYITTIDEISDLTGDDRVGVDMDGTAGLTLASGATTNVHVYIKSGTGGYGELTSGTTVNVKLHSAGGMDYIKIVELV